MSAGTGNLRLHPQDSHVIRGVGFASPTGGDVKLDRVVDAPRLRRRVEREDAGALKARLIREKRREQRKRKLRNRVSP